MKAEKTQESGEKEEKHTSVIKELLETIIYIIFIVCAMWLIITYVGQFTEVDGSSMYDTLEDGDNLWINKAAYRLHDPERFDIVVFRVSEDKYYIKRIIGLPGETVYIDENGVIYINDEILEEDYGYEVISPNMIGRASELVILGEDEYFVMGDNRNGSMDSREESVGNIERERLIGRVSFRMWPLSRFGIVE